MSAVYHHVQANPVPVYVKLRGLEEGSSYRIRLVENTRKTGTEDGPEKETVCSGAALMHAGLLVPPARGDYYACQIHIVKV